MPFPTGTSTITVTGKFPIPAGGDPQAGSVVFTPSATLVDGTQHVIYSGSGVATLDGTGAFSKALLCTDDTDVQPAGWRWRVDEQIPGSRRTYFVDLPSTLGATVDLSTLAPVSGPGGSGQSLPPTGPAGGALTGSYPNPQLSAATIASFDAAGSAATAQVNAEAYTDNVAANQLNLPSEQNLLAWAYDPDMAGHVTAQSAAGVGGRITLTRIILRKQITWSNIWIGLAGVDAGASLANCYLGVYDSAGNLLGSTADISSSLSSGAVAKPLPLAAPFAAAPGTYFIAMLLNGTWTTNSFTFKCSGAGSSTNAGLTAPNLRYSNMLTGQTSLPASLTLANQTTTIITTGWASQWYGIS